MSNSSPYLSPLSEQEIEQNFADISPLLSSKEAFLESSRCLYCYDAPCTKACPTSINVPRFIQQINSADVAGAAKTIFTQNILGSSCGSVCPTEVLCEGACVYNGLNQKPIEIGRLQRFASEHALKKNLRFFGKGKASGKRVAIVGAGPAGLSCAHELVKLGHEAVVFEAQDKAGGLNTYGIARYKLDPASALREVDYIRGIGVEIRYNTPIGRHPSVSDLLKEYDAVFLGIGLGGTSKLGIEGEEGDGCVEALDFIRPTREENFNNCKIGEQVIVIGAGNTAIDAATAAVRLGAKTTSIVYRRTAKEMPAFQYEYELAKKDGVQFHWLTSPIRVVRAAGKVSGLECARMRLVQDGSARGRLETEPGSEHVIACDMIIKALGQDPLQDLLAEVKDKQGKALTLKNGCVQIQNESGATSVNGLFAGGDCINGGGEVVDAVQHGKVAALGINAYLTRSTT